MDICSCRVALSQRVVHFQDDKMGHSARGPYNCSFCWDGLDGNAVRLLRKIDGYRQILEKDVMNPRYTYQAFFL